MMLDQFQACYPTGSLISELLTIYQGKFVVQVSVQIDGVIRATGLAAAETPEEAEDKARSRAIALVSLEAPLPAAKAIPEPLPKPFVPEPVAQPSALAEPMPELNYEANTHNSAVAPYLAGEAQRYASPLTELEPKHTATLELKSNSKGNSKSAVTHTPPADEEEVFGDFGKISEPTDLSSSTLIALGSITSTPRYEPQLDISQETNVSEPIDLSEDLITISAKLQESGWKPDQEREYLERTYGKSSRHELTPVQVQEFRRYLELFSETTQVTKELRELDWNKVLGQRYLAQTFNKKLRQELNYQQLQEFLQFLQAERDRLSTKK
jgi:hypothetical protein